MSTTASSSLTNPAVAGLRSALGASGSITVLAGIAIVIGFGYGAGPLAGILGVYAIVNGLIYLGMGASVPTLGGARRTVQAILGLIFIAVGVIAMIGLATAPAWVFQFFGIVLGIAWILDGVTAVTLPGNERARSWAVLFALIIVVGGILLLFSPMWDGLLRLWALFGWTLVIAGSLQLTRSARFSVDPD